MLVAKNMTEEEWATSNCAPTMLKSLYLRDPDHFKTLIPILHRYFLACCRKIQHLAPQKHLRNGIIGAEKWIKGDITDEALNDLNWYAEAEAFAIDYAKSPEEIVELKSMINGIEELDGIRLSNRGIF